MAPRAAAAVPDAINRPDLTIGGNVVPGSHEFPVGRAADIRRMFDGNGGVGSYPISVVSSAGAQTQFVNPKPVFMSDHRFVIGLPPSMHIALDQIIAQLDKQPTHTSSTYELTFWAVEAVAATESDVPRDLAEIAPMLEKLTGFGKRRFKSLDRVAALSRDTAGTKVAGRMLKVEHTLQWFPEGIELKLALELAGAGTDKPESGPRIETTLQVPLDRPVVIGDTAQSASADGAANLVLYVVRAKRVD
ncbi:MAG: hypothetical protein ABI175_24410 [Polyangiales bacterium]